ncbi:cytochrome P450 2G1-like [Anomaloglossus baeobatrachus]|uniref:cytochrome P450 2G1-like n=1 Tax=Anomaloglossus baeobatrachus TaxID=238106 RepID=UPI003F506C87
MDFGGYGSAILVLCVTCLILLFMWSENSKQKKLPPGPTPLPFLGNMLQLNMKELPKSLIKLAKVYGDVFTVYLGPRRVVIIHGCDAVKEALIDNAHVFSERGKFPAIQILFKNFGIILSNGERWKQLRRFALTTLRNFGMGKKSLEEKIQEEAGYLKDEFSKTKGQPCDPTYFLTLAVSNMICSIVFGERFEYEDKKFLALLALIKDTFAAINSRTGQLLNSFPQILQKLPGPHQRVYRNIKALKSFVQEKVKEHQETFDPNCARDFIDCFLVKMTEEKGNPDTEFHFDNMFVSVLNLFFAGTETTSSTLRHGLRMLLKYPDIQAKVQKEIDVVIGQDRSPSLEDRSKMPYTEAVIHEIHRYSDIVPLGLPHAAYETTNFRGHTIPKDTTVFPLLTSVLKDPKYFKNPARFDPEHFLNKKGEFEKNEAFLPFSAGRRICLGEGMARMEIFLFLTFILQNFNLETDENPSDIDITPLPYKIRFVPRL